MDDNTFITVNVHVHADSPIEVIHRSDSGMTTHWVKIGDITLFVDDADMARLHAATQPVTDDGRTYGRYSVPMVAKSPSWVVERQYAADPAWHAVD